MASLKLLRRAYAASMPLQYQTSNLPAISFSTKSQSKIKQACLRNLRDLCFYFCRDSQIRELALELLVQFPAAELHACLSIEEWQCICDAALDPGEGLGFDEALNDTDEQPAGIW